MKNLSGVNLHNQEIKTNAGKAEVMVPVRTKTGERGMHYIEHLAGLTHEKREWP